MDGRSVLTVTEAREADTPDPDVRVDAGLRVDVGPGAGRGLDIGLVGLAQARAAVEFAYVDVFAEVPLTGAPLTVVPDADGLSRTQMTAIAREFNPAMGIAEDPATLTAAGPLAARLARESRQASSAVRPDDAFTVVISQGHRVGRPSTIVAAVVGGAVEVSGSGLIVGRGSLAVPEAP